MVFIHYSQKYREILPCPRLCLLVETHKAQAIEVPLKEKMIENLYCLENNNDDLYQSYFFRDKFVCQHRFQYICIIFQGRNSQSFIPMCIKLFGVVTICVFICGWVCVRMCTGTCSKLTHIAIVTGQWNVHGNNKKDIREEN